jgi:hypothetical protein
MKVIFFSLSIENIFKLTNILCRVKYSKIIKAFSHKLYILPRNKRDLNYVGHLR